MSTETVETPRNTPRRQGASHLLSARRQTEEGDTLEKVLKGEFSQQITDPFASRTGASGTSKLNEIPPPYNLPALLRMAQENSVLKQCIEAMVTNIPGHGHRLEYVGPEGQNTSTDAETEAGHITDFLSTPNDDYSLQELMKRVRWDLEAIGNAYIEVARNRAGDVTAAWHIPGHLMRLTEADKEATTVKMETSRFGKKTTVTTEKYFRRFVQIKGMKKVYFKEFGDPRSISPKDGSAVENLAFNDTATEIIHLKLYHAGHVYGLPRWINNIVAIQGSRQAELTNLDYFADNAVPAMMISIAGGYVSQQTINMLEQHFTSVRGRAASNRVVVFEAQGDEFAKDEKGAIPPPQIKIDNMGAHRPKEGMFLDYDKAQTDKIRSSFRLPPIFLGLSEDYTHATANTSYDVAEGQVFGPERVTDDDVVNRKLLGGYDLKYWEVKSNQPRITDPQEILNAVQTFDDTGAMTPNTAIGIANELFDLQIDMIEEEWGNLPMSVVDLLVTSGRLAPDKDGRLEFREVDNPEGAAGAGEKPGAEDKDEDEDATKTVRRSLMDLRRVLLRRKATEADAAALSKPVRSRTRVRAA